MLKMSLLPEGYEFEIEGKVKFYPANFRDSLEFEKIVASDLGVEPKDVLEAEFRELERTITTDELAEILSSTVKEDRTSKLICFYGFLNTFTDSNQVNIGFEASSSTGKSYISQEIAAYFPSEDVRICGYTSPMAFFHESGTWDPDNKQIILDMERKIYVFIDQPHDQLLHRLRPIMSHDKKEITVRIADKSEKRGLRTKRVIVKGFSTFAFCAARSSPDEQEKTRMILLSPESTREKLTASLYLQALKKGDYPTFRNLILSDPRRKWLEKRVHRVKEAGIPDVLIVDHKKIVDRFIEEHKGRLVARHQRDLEKLIALIKGQALLNFPKRKKVEDGRIEASEEDIEAGFKLYAEISESNELGLPPEVFRVYKQIVEPNLKLDEGLASKKILEVHYSEYGTALDPKKLRNDMIPAWLAANLCHEELDPTDRRKRLLYPLERKYISRYVSSDSGVSTKPTPKGTISLYLRNVPLPEDTSQSR